MKKILFFTPFGGRSGSEMMLWYVLENFDRELFKAQLFCNTNGELLSSMPKDVESFCGQNSYLNRVSVKIKNQFFRQQMLHEKQIIAIHKRFRPDYWYLNTIVMGDVIPIARRLGVKVITHFHEMPIFYQLFSKDHLEDIFDYSKAIIGCSESVCKEIRVLTKNNLFLQHEFVDISKIATQEKRVNEIKRELGISPNDFVWVMSGRQEANKGIDMLPKIVNSFDTKNTHFIWLGGGDNGLAYLVKRQIMESGGNNVHFLGVQKEDYYNYMAVGNAFLLLSRQDSFPLVMIEAAFLSKPTISFNSGGVKEFVLEGMGEVIDSWNIADLVKAMKALVSGSTETDEKLINSRAGEFNSKLQIKQWQNTMKSIFEL